MPREIALRIRPEVAKHLAYYVYAYIDPDSRQIFYVGKGCRGRVLRHLNDQTECNKTQRIVALQRQGKEPVIEILAHGMTTEEMAFRVEAAVIDALGLDSGLTNRVRGFRALQFGRVPLSELEILYAAKPVTISEPVLLIRINRLYKPTMSSVALYEATRGIWKVGERRHGARYAMAVYEGVVRQVYQIECWYPAGTTPYATRTDETLLDPERWEFSGPIASALSANYTGGRVDHYLNNRARNPIKYVNC